MLNTEQQKWTLTKLEILLGMAKDFQLSEDDYSIMLEYSNKTINQAKGNEAVKEALLTTLTYIEKMNKILGADNEN